MGCLWFHHTVKPYINFCVIGDHIAIGIWRWHGTNWWCGASHCYRWGMWRSWGWTRLNRGCSCGCRDGAVTHSNNSINWSNACSFGYLKYYKKLIRYRSGDIKFYQHVTDTYSFHCNVISSISISESFILFWLIFTQQYIFIPLSFDTVFFTVTIDLDIRRLTISKFHSLFSVIVYMFSHFLFCIRNRVMKN